MNVSEGGRYDGDGNQIEAPTAPVKALAIDPEAERVGAEKPVGAAPAETPPAPPAPPAPPDPETQSEPEPAKAPGKKER